MKTKSLMTVLAILANMKTAQKRRAARYYKLTDVARTRREREYMWEQRRGVAGTHI